MRPETAMLIEQYLPTFDLRDDHDVRVVAPADTAYAALCSLDLTPSWMVQALFTIRSLPSRLRHLPPPPSPSGTFLAQALAVAWVVLEEAPDPELVAGAVTQPWRPIVTFQGLPPAEFLSLTTPGSRRSSGRSRPGPLHQM